MKYELLSKGVKQMSLTLNGQVLNSYLFNNYFNCGILIPSKIFEYKMDGEQYLSKGTEIENVFNSDYQEKSDDKYEEVYNDQIFRFLDNMQIKIEDGVYKPIKKSDYEYQFFFLGKEGNASVNLIVSRQKVIRLCALLKKNNLWIDNDTPDLIKINTLLSILLKDTVITRNEFACVRGYIKNGVLYLGGKHR